MKNTNVTSLITESEYVDKMQRINQKKLFSLLYPNTIKLGCKPGLSLSAQSSGQYSTRSVIEESLTSLISRIEDLRNSDLLLFYIAHLQLIGSLRISEVLNIRSYDIDMLGHITIKGLKGSKDLVLFAGESKEYLIQCKRSKIDPFTLYSRFYVYREYKKKGIVFQSLNSSRKSVTHAIRQLNAMALRYNNKSNSDVSVLLHHSGNKSQRYYGYKK